MRVNFKQVRPEDLDVQELLALAREGEMYRKVKVEEISKRELLARCRQEALEYVKPINEYATEEWLPYINKVWKAVVNERCISSNLVLSRKRELNRYFLTNLVFNLQMLGLYKPAEKVSPLRLHQALENTEGKNSAYKNAGKYGVTKEQRVILRQILEKYQRV